MKPCVWFLLLVVFWLIIGVTPIPLEASERPQIFSSIDNLESRLSKTENSLDRLQQFLTQRQQTRNILENSLSGSGEACIRIRSFLDERQAGSFYLDSELTSRAAAEGNDLNENVETFKDKFLKDKAPSKKERLAISRQLIQALLKLGKYQEALEVCKNFSDRYPQSKTDIVRLYCLVGASYQDSQEYDNAVESYQQALLYDAGDAYTSHVRVNLGWCYYKKGEYDKAIDEYNRALQEGFIDSDTTQWAYLQIGRCYFFLENYEDATKFFLQALNINPDSKLAQQAKVNIEDVERLKKGGCNDSTISQ